MSANVARPARTGNYPLMNMAEDFGLPLGVVYLYADALRINILRFNRGEPEDYSDNRHAQAALVAAEMLNNEDFVEFNFAVARQVRSFLRLQGHIP